MIMHLAQVRCGKMNANVLKISFEFEGLKTEHF